MELNTDTHIPNKPIAIPSNGTGQRIRREG